MSPQRGPSPPRLAGVLETVLCFVAPAEAYQAWKVHLAAHGVPAIEEIT